MWIAVEAIGANAGWVAVAGSAARLVCGPLGGVYADRWDRQRAMLWADWLRAGAVATLALSGLLGPVSLWHLAAVSLWLGALDSLFSPALQASLPALTRDSAELQRANAWLNMTPRLAAAIGPPLTGALLALMPIDGLFAVDAATFAGSALVIRALGRGYAWKAEPGGARPVGARGVLLEIRASARLAAANPELRWGIGLVSIWNLALTPALLVGMPLLARDVLGRGPEAFGYMVGAYGVGNVLSNLVLTRFPVRRRGVVMLSGGAIAALGWLALASTSRFELILLAAALAAVGGPLTDVVLLQIIQTDFAPDQIGKIFSLRFTLSRACQGLGLAGSGLLYAAGVTAGITTGALVVGSYAVVGALRFSSLGISRSAEP